MEMGTLKPSGFWGSRGFPMAFDSHPFPLPPEFHRFVTMPALLIPNVT